MNQVIGVCAQGSPGERGQKGEAGQQGQQVQPAHFSCLYCASHAAAAVNHPQEDTCHIRNYSERLSPLCFREFLVELELRAEKDPQAPG